MCSVLVTGGAGFLGQHVVGLLQTHADHVTEIRVLDVVPYENKLDYIHKKPLRCYVGSITDECILREAMLGVQSVIHIAGVTDSSMFPNETRIWEVNVKGTVTTLLTALASPGVQRFIYCSTSSVGIGYDTNTTHVIQESDSVPKRFIFEPYASSKFTAERLVASANGECFQTLCIRPPVMYGELDLLFISAGQKMARYFGGTLMSVDCRGVKQQHCYVGNTAWGFICAESKLYKDSLTMPLRNPSNRVIDELTRKLNKSKQIGPQEANDSSKMETAENFTNNAYYIVDDTPVSDPFVFQRPFLEASGYNVSRFALPMTLVIIVFLWLYYILKCIKAFFPKVNYPVSVSAVKFLKKPYIFSDAKARRELGYMPLFPPNEARKRSLLYYKLNSGS